MNTLPAAALMQHIASLGKTGSGKTSTIKLLIEERAAAGRPLERGHIAAAARVSPTSSGLSKGLKELCALDLIEHRPGNCFELHPHLKR